MENKNSKMWLGALVVLILAVALWMWWSSSAVAPGSSTSGNDKTASINSDLNSINVADHTQDVQSTNADVNSL